MLERILGTITALAVLAPTSGAGVPERAVRQFLLDLPARNPVAYTIPFDAPREGPLAIECRWDAARVLSFRVVDPSGTVHRRRTGVSPVRIDLTVPAAQAEGTWTVTVRGLTGRDASSATLSILVPSPVEEAPAELPGAPEREPREEWPAWTASELPRGHRELATRTDRFLAHLEAEEHARRDRYAWQRDFARYVVDVRDGRNPLPDPETRELLARTVEAIRRVERLSETRDPLVAGPPPSDAGRARTWLMLRERRLRPLETELDLLLEAAHGLEDSPAVPPWLPRFVACLVACERHFEASGRVGSARAVHRDVVDEQWQRILLARDSLASVTTLPVPAP